MLHGDRGMRDGPSLRGSDGPWEHGGGAWPPRRQALKLLPQPQPPVEFGLLNVKPDPCIDET